MHQAPEPRPPADDPALRTLLRTWSVDASVPPRFGEAVWRRIDARQASASGSASPWRVLATWLGQCLTQPRFAVAYLALLFLVGAGAGALRGQRHSESATGGLQGQYIASIDPYFASGLR